MHIVIVDRLRAVGPIAVRQFGIRFFAGAVIQIVFIGIGIHRLIARVIVAVGLLTAGLLIVVAVPLVMNGDEISSANLAIEINTGFAFEAARSDIAVSSIRRIGMIKKKTPVIVGRTLGPPNGCGIAVGAWKYSLPVVPDRMDQN